MLETVPALPLGRLHLLGQLLDRRLELGAHHVGQLPVQVQHRRVGRPPHPHPPRLVPLARVLRGRLRRVPRQARQIRRRHLRRPPRPLRITRLVRELRHRAQLLGTQRTVIRRRRDLGQRLEAPRRLHLVTHRPRRLALIPERRVDSTPLVEHPKDRELLGLQPTLRVHHLDAASLQPIRRPRPQLVEVIGDVEHAPIQTQGCDTHRRPSPPVAARRRPSPTAATRQAADAGMPCRSTMRS